MSDNILETNDFGFALRHASVYSSSAWIKRFYEDKGYYPTNQQFGIKVNPKYRDIIVHGVKLTHFSDYNVDNIRNTPFPILPMGIYAIGTTDSLCCYILDVDGVKKLYISGYDKNGLFGEPGETYVDYHISRYDGIAESIYCGNSNSNDYLNWVCVLTTQPDTLNHPYTLNFYIPNSNGNPTVVEGVWDNISCSRYHLVAKISGTERYFIFPYVYDGITKREIPSTDGSRVFAADWGYYYINRTLRCVEARSPGLYEMSEYNGLRDITGVDWAYPVWWGLILQMADGGYDAITGAIYGLPLNRTRLNGLNATDNPNIACANNTFAVFTKHGTNRLYAYINPIEEIPVPDSPRYGYYEEIAPYIPPLADKSESHHNTTWNTPKDFYIKVVQSTDISQRNVVNYVSSYIIIIYFTIYHIIYFSILLYNLYPSIFIYPPYLSLYI